MVQNTYVKVIVDGFEFEFSQEDLNNIFISKVPGDKTVARFKERTFDGVVSKISTRYYNTEVKGRLYDVKIKNPLDQLVDSLGYNSVKISKLPFIKAPMPGLIVSIDVAEGENVTENTKILTLEAMKMENTIKIPHDAIIRKVLVKPGQAVEKGQILIELE